MEDFDSKLKKRTKDNIANKDDRNYSKGKFFLDLSSYEDVEQFKPDVEDLNLIDILPYEVTTNNHPQGLSKGDPDYKLDIWVHYNVGPSNDTLLCLSRTFGKACPICEERDKRLKNGSEWKSPEIQSLLPSRKVIYNLIDLKDSQKLKLFITSHKYFEHELLEEAEDNEKEEEQIIFSSLNDGRSIRFKAIKETWEKREYFKYKKFRFIEREKPYKKDILKKVYPLDALLIIPTYNEVKDSFFGLPFDENEEEVPNDYINGSSENKSLNNIESENDSNCPYGFEFGNDCDEKEECEGCEEKTWESCANQQARSRRKKIKN